MENFDIDYQKITVRLAETPGEIHAAQRLRYKVFYEENGAKPTPEMAAIRRDFDSFDSVADHLIVIDSSVIDPEEAIVGTYRLLREENANEHGCFYTSGEFDISPLLNSRGQLLELGRSCVLADYRTRPVLQLLWQGITDYMLDYNIQVMFGCASLHGINVHKLSQQLSYLHHYHLASEELRPQALKERYVAMDLVPKDEIDTRAAFNALPPLIKGYLRVGAGIGDGAVIDEQFNTIDVCIILPMEQVANRYRRFYSRKTKREIPESTTASQNEDSRILVR